MKDISLPNYTSAKVVDRILEEKILFQKVQEAVHSLFLYAPRMYPFYTGIKADYLISSHFGISSFVFIIKANMQSERECDFLCCSIFQKGNRDYASNQCSRVLMKKERIHIPTNTSVILLDQLTPQKTAITKNMKESNNFSITKKPPDSAVTAKTGGSDFQEFFS